MASTRICDEYWTYRTETARDERRFAPRDADGERRYPQRRHSRERHGDGENGDGRRAVGGCPSRHMRCVARRFQRDRGDGDAQLAMVSRSWHERRRRIDADGDAAGAGTPRSSCGKGDVAFDRLIGDGDPVHADSHLRHRDAWRPPYLEIGGDAPVDLPIDGRKRELGMGTAPRKHLVFILFEPVEALAAPAQLEIGSQKDRERRAEIDAQEHEEGDDPCNDGRAGCDK